MTVPLSHPCGRTPRANALSRSQPRQDFPPLFERTAKLHTATMNGAFFHDLHDLELADTTDGPRGHNQDLLIFEWNEDPAEHSTVDVGRTRAGHLDLERSALGLGLGDDFRDRGLALNVHGLEPGGQLLTHLKSLCQRLADGRHHLHVLGVVHGRKDLARRDRVSGVHLLVDIVPAIVARTVA